MATGYQGYNSVPQSDEAGGYPKPPAYSDPNYQGYPDEQLHQPVNNSFGNQGFYSDPQQSYYPQHQGQPPFNPHVNQYAPAPPVLQQQSTSVRSRY